MLSNSKPAWKRSAGLLIVASLLALAVLQVNLQEVASEPSTIIVPDHYPSIQAAINAASAGDTIFVKNGTYHEQVIINKTVSVVGEDKEATIVDGDGSGNVTLIVANDVNLTGFTIRNSSWSVYPNAAAGLVLRNSSDCDIYGNNLINNYYGVWASNSPYCSFSSNLMSSNEEDGIVLQTCPHSEVEGNNVSGNGEAGIILFSQTNHSIVSDNLVLGNKGLKGSSGIELVDSSYVTITHNNVTGNKGGILIKNNSSNNSVTDNTVTANSVNNFKLSLYCNYNNFSQNTITKSGADAIWVEAYSSNNTFSDNEVTGNRWGFWITHSSYNRVISNNISSNVGRAIWLDSYANFNHIQGNTMTGNNVGIGFTASHNNTIRHNVISGCRLAGLVLEFTSRFNVFIWNNIEGCPDGVQLMDPCSGNGFYLNRFANNTRDVYDATAGSISYLNTWDYGYPSGGNYWSGYSSKDLSQGAGQNISGSDGVSDSPKLVYKGNQDNYPLMGEFNDFSAAQDASVQITCNSSTSGLSYNGSALTVNISGCSGSIGFCRVCIPAALMSGPFKTYVDGTEIENQMLLCSNSTHSYLYFYYAHPAQEITLTRGSFASFTWNPLASHFNETVNFDASASLPSVGEIVSYEWDFGDGNTSMLTTPEISHAYCDASDFSVVLNVTDSEGNWDTKELAICVLPACEPKANFTWLPSQVCVNNTVTFDAASSTRGWNGTCYPPIVTYLWDFGDGSLTTSENATIEHVYSANGYYTVNLTIFDADNSSDTLALQVNVLASIPGDVNGDGIVNMLDLYKIALNYGKTAPYDTPEIANCDVDNNGIINMLDLYIAAIHYGQTGS